MNVGEEREGRTDEGAGEVRRGCGNQPRSVPSGVTTESVWLGGPGRRVCGPRKAGGLTCHVGQAPPHLPNKPSVRTALHQAQDEVEETRSWRMRQVRVGKAERLEQAREDMDGQYWNNQLRLRSPPTQASIASSPSPREGWSKVVGTVTVVQIEDVHGDSLSRCTDLLVCHTCTVTCAATSHANRHTAGPRQPGNAHACP